MRVGRMPVCAVVLCAIAPLGGCGSSASLPDPATLVPPSASLYLEVALRPPGGEHGSDATALRKLTHLANPFASLSQALLGIGGTKLEWRRDLAPWVGQRAGVFVTFARAGAKRTAAGSASAAAGGGSATTGGGGFAASATANEGLTGIWTKAFASGAAQGAIVVQAGNLGGARSFLAKLAARQHARAVRYRGVGYYLQSPLVAEALVGRFVVLGSDSALRAVIDTSIEHRSLSRSSGYEKADAGAIASLYGASAGLDRALPGLAASGVDVVNAQLAATSDSLSLNARIRYASASAARRTQGGAQALAALPGGSWLAAGIGGAGGGTGGGMAQQGSSPLSAAGAASVAMGLKALGIGPLAQTLSRLLPGATRIERRIARWAGPVTAFASGSGLFDLQAAVVVDSRDRAASRAAVGEIATLMRRAKASVNAVAVPGTDAAVSVRLSGVPVVLYVADGQGKLILGFGQASVLGALRPSGRLSASPSYSSARRALGGLAPSLILEFPALLALLEGIGLTQNPPLSELVPYLKPLGTLAAGSTLEGTAVRVRAVLGLAG